MQFSGRGILLDVEGTTSSIQFVYEVMFPYARDHLHAYLRENWDNSDARKACHVISVDAGYADWDEFTSGCATAERQRERLADKVLQLMDEDRKTTGLKTLQGMIWKSGFESGQMVAHVYEDVVPAIQRWNELGLDVRIYSSGSIAAQKLFFGHTGQGDLLDQFRGHYDTTTGAKKESASYGSIAEDFGISAADILFLSDVTDELAAAATAGMVTALCVRPGNPTCDVEHPYPELRSFADVELVIAH